MTDDAYKILIKKKDNEILQLKALVGQYKYRYEKEKNYANGKPVFSHTDRTDLRHALKTISDILDRFDRIESEEGKEDG